MTETTNPLTTERVDELVEACMLDASTAPVAAAIVSRGILNDYVFDPERIEEHHEQVHELLLQLPDQFQLNSPDGGGWSFLNMCLTKDQEQWTGLHSEQEALMCLGQAAGWMTVQPRHQWKLMYGEMPYVTVLTERKQVELTDAETMAEINRQMLEHMATHEHDEPETVDVQTAKCIHCGKTGSVTMPREAFERFEAGEHVQRAWPEGSAGDREQLINGTHDACFKAMFPEDEEL